MKTEDIEELVENKPGMSFTELKEQTGAANGQLQYHLNKAEVEKKGRGYVKESHCQNCSLRSICAGRCLRFYVRQEKNRKILKMLDDSKKMDIAEELSISPSTLSYHINQLENNNLIEEGKVNSKVKRVI